MKKIKEFTLIFIITISLFVLIEIGLRIWSYFSGRAIFSSLTIDDPVLDWKLTPNYNRKTADISINSQGFRGPDFSRSKGGLILIRIISIGDSCTFGDGSSQYEFTYPRLLEKKLNSIHSANIFQVINAGVPGYTSHQCWLYFKNKLLELNPDIIILYCGWNDIWAYKNP